MKRMCRHTNSVCPLSYTKTHTKCVCVFNTALHPFSISRPNATTQTLEIKGS